MTTTKIKASNIEDGSITAVKLNADVIATTLPIQTSHAGQYLTSDGTDASWALLGNAATVTTNANLTGGVTSVGNAATVVTNANLTGVITSSGNATSIASQTGTGSKFVVDNSPTLTTPVINGFTGNTSVINIGSGQVYKDASGNVGIGTASPSKLLDVGGVFRVAVSASTADVTGKADNTGGVNIYGGSAFNAGSGIVTTGSANATPNIILFTRGAFVESMRIHASGGVSIGNTSDPGATNLSVTGFASAASFRPTSSTIPTNGMYLPAANSVGIATNSTNAIYINSSQNVGIGATSPGYLVEVSRSEATTYSASSASALAPFSSTSAALIVRNTSNTASSGSYIGLIGIDGAGTTNLAYIGAITVNASFSSNIVFGQRTGSTAYTERMRLDSSGSLGIGTASPAQKLDVNGNIKVGTNQWIGNSAGASYVADDGVFGGTIFNGGGFKIHTAAVERMRIDIAGNVGIGTASPVSKLQVINNLAITASSGYQNLLIGNQDSGGTNNPCVLQSANGFLAFGNGDSWASASGGTFTEKMRIHNSGGVSIGNTSDPSAGNLRLGLGSTTAQSMSLWNNSGFSYFGIESSTGGTYITGSTAYSTIINSASSQAIQFGSGGTLLATLTASGNLLLGTTTPVTSNGTNLNIYGASASNLSLQNSTSGTGNGNGFQLIQDGVITYLQNRENGAMTFATNNTERMRIDASGNLSVGTTSSGTNGKLYVYETTFARLYLTDSTLGTAYGGQVRGWGATASGGQVSLGAVDANAYNEGIRVTNQATTVQFYTTSGVNGTTTERMRIHASGGVSIGNTTDPGATNLSVTGTGKFGTTVGVGAATPSTSGAGITFPATQSASSDANTLDDYEEGTWTVTDASGATLSFTANTTAAYTKIGRLVYCTFDITYPSTASVASMAWSGLPFASSASNNGVVSIGYSTYTNVITGVHGVTDILFYNKANSPSTAMLNVDASLKRFIGSITYFV